jgi:hypothetical protein
LRRIRLKNADQEVKDMKVYETKDYTKFKFITGNRPITRYIVNKFKREFENGRNYLNRMPMSVFEHNGHLEIMDGQHRFIAAQELEQPVSYMISDRMTLLDIAKININTHKWRLKDFIHIYTTEGNENYKILEWYSNRYEIPLSVAAGILLGWSPGAGNAAEAIVNGTFQVKNLEEAKEFAEKVRMFSEWVNFATHKTFLSAFNTVYNHPEYDHDRMIQKIKLHPRVFVKCGDRQQYLQMFEEIYNYRTTRDFKVYFTR